MNDEPKTPWADWSDANSPAIEAAEARAKEAGANGQPQQARCSVADCSPFVVNDWLKTVIEGPSGMNAYERHEMVSWNESERMAAARWVIGCLANPRCAGSAEMLHAIHVRREERLANTRTDAPTGRVE